jgi:hypothetical protein
MIHIDKDSEGSEYVQLDDYYINNDDYMSDTPGLDLNAAGHSPITIYVYMLSTLWEP